MRRRRFVLPAVAALGGSLLLPLTAARATEPWASGTVFVAESGQRTSSGGLWAVTPDGTKTLLGSGSAEDVAVAPDGTVWWVEMQRWPLQVHARRRGGRSGGHAR